MLAGEACMVALRVGLDRPEAGRKMVDLDGWVLVVAWVTCHLDIWVEDMAPVGYS